MYDFDKPSERRYGDAISIPVHSTIYLIIPLLLLHRTLRLTIRKFDRPEDRHAQEPDRDDGEARSVRARYFGGALPLRC
jgi:hypothetical protein